MAILVSGGAGVIGSHTVVELLNSNEDVVLFDNFSNSPSTIVNFIKTIAKKDFKFYKADLCDRKMLKRIFEENYIEAVIHFAGYKYIKESIHNSLKYYENNVGGSCCLLKVMNKYNCRKLIFSSSAAVYAIPEKLPIDETGRLAPITPYGQTKLIIENICHDLYNSNSEWRISLLRYFNPIDAHESGLIGDISNQKSDSLMSSIFKVATGKQSSVKIYGNDYPTEDGTCVRDFIHITDLAFGHLAALNKVRNDTGIISFNLGTGCGYSVLELIRTFEKESNIEIPFTFTERRKGDVCECYSNTNKAERILGWKAAMNLHDMCRDSWRFISRL